MNKILKEARNIYQEGCLTIILNTHRTKPANEKDPLVLKNLLKEAEERLHSQYDKGMAMEILENLGRLAEKIDHSRNLESLILFVNRDFADYTRLPVAVENRVVIDHSFATRDLVRAMHQESAYYVLVLSRQKARLIEAYNDRVVQEIKGDFPIINQLYTTDRFKLSTAKGQDNLIEEFFNRVDKTAMEAIKDHPLPFVIASENRNYDHYLKVADKKDLIIGWINRTREDDPAHSIVKDAWTEVKSLVKKKNQERIKELLLAVGQNKFVSDINEIWKAIREGRGKTLFVDKGFFQPATIKEGNIVLAEASQKDQTEMIDDIIDELIEQNLSYGGDVVFVGEGEIDQFQNIALVTRY